MRITRRRFNRGVLTLGALTLGFTAAGGARRATAKPFADRLREDLAACLESNPTSAAFTVRPREVDETRRDGQVWLSAEVQLDWAPGTRIRVLHGSGPTEDDAYVELRRKAVDLFVDVVPGFERPADAT